MEKLDELSARIERCQEEVDRCRELLRKGGIEGFGSLSEGIELALKRQTRPMALVIPDAQVQEISEAILGGYFKIRGHDMGKQQRFALLDALLRAEILNVIVQAWAIEAKIDLDDLIGNIEGALRMVLRGRFDEMLSEALS